MPQTAPLVSVCIPTYNRAEGLRRAVKAVQDGDFADVEIIISDNASGDATETVARALAAADPRVRYFRHPRNQGPTRNFAFAREQARGKYFAWCGDDDWFAPDYLRRCVEALESDGQLVLAAGLGAYHRGDDQVIFHGNRLPLESPHAIVRLAHYLFRARDNSVFYGLYRRAAVAPCHMPNSLGGDWIWLADVLFRGRARVIPDSHVFRRYGDTTSSTHERIVATLGAPAWQARHRFLAITCNFRHYFRASSDYRARPLALRFAFMALLMAAMAFRSMRQNGKKALLRLPLLGPLLNRMLDPH